MTIKILVASLLVLCACHCSGAQARPSQPHAPPHFRAVRSGLYRGGHPDGAALDYLRSIGVRTVVDLEIADLIEATAAQIDEERAGVAARGMRFVHAPMSAFEPALSDRFDGIATRALQVIGDPNAAPVYVHCLHGQDRTGLVIGLERVEQEHWAPDRAYREMVALGFHPMFLGLRDYFERRTGYEP